MFCPAMGVVTFCWLWIEHWQKALETVWTSTCGSPLPIRWVAKWPWVRPVPGGARCLLCGETAWVELCDLRLPWRLCSQSQWFTPRSLLHSESSVDWQNVSQTQLAMRPYCISEVAELIVPLVWIAFSCILAILVTKVLINNRPVAHKSWAI